MLGDNFRRMQADELDADWDRLVRNEQGSKLDSLSMISGELNSLIAPANPEAKGRVRQQIFADTWRGTATSRKQPMRPMASQSMPFNPARSERTERWWSSPMAALEAVIACLVIAALALGISAYQSNGDRESPRFLASMLERTPEQASSAPTPDYDMMEDVYAAMRPASAAWQGPMIAGKHVVMIRELYLPENVGFSYDTESVSLFIVLSGTVTVTSDSTTPATVGAGETASLSARSRIGIKNTGSGVAMVFQAVVMEGTDVYAAWGDDPSTRGSASFLRGYALIDFQSGGIAITLEALDESSMSRAVGDGGYELFCSVVGPNSLLVSNGRVDLMSGGIEEPYQAISPGTTTIFGYGSGFFASPDSTYNLTALGDSDVLGFSLRIETEQAPSVKATPSG